MGRPQCIEGSQDRHPGSSGSGCPCFLSPHVPPPLPPAGPVQPGRLCEARVRHQLRGDAARAGGAFGCVAQVAGRPGMQGRWECGGATGCAGASSRATRQGGLDASGMQHAQRVQWPALLRPSRRPQVHANCRIRRIYFSDRLYSEAELPPEFKVGGGGRGRRRGAIGCNAWPVRDVCVADLLVYHHTATTPLFKRPTVAPKLSCLPVLRPLLPPAALHAHCQGAAAAAAAGG